MAEVILKEIIDLDWTHPTRGNVKFEVETTLGQRLLEPLRLLRPRHPAPRASSRERPQRRHAAAPAAAIQRQKSMHEQLLRSSMPVWDSVLKQSPENPYALAGLSKAYLHDRQRGCRHPLRQPLHPAQQEEPGRLAAGAQGLGRADGRARSRASSGPSTWTRSTAPATRRSASISSWAPSTCAASSSRRRSSSTTPSWDSTRPRTAAYVERAQAYAALGLYPQAVKDLEQFLQHHGPAEAATGPRQRRRPARPLPPARRAGARWWNSRAAGPRGHRPGPRRVRLPRPGGQAYGNPDGRVDGPFARIPSLRRGVRPLSVRSQA